jgi:uncharacterized protein YjdB
LTVCRKEPIMRQSAANPSEREARLLQTLVNWLAVGLAVAGLVGCVGTDYIADAPILGASRIDIVPASAALTVGESIELRAIFVDEAGQSIDDVRFTWTSADTTIAGISEAGVLLGHSEGQVAVFAAADGVTSEQILVGVVADAETQVATVAISPAALTLAPGDTLSFQVESLNAAGAFLPGQSYTWSSSDSLVLQVDAQGHATAVASGSATVQARTSGRNSNEAHITIMAASRSGSFVGRDDSHENRGVALLQPGTDGALVLSFADDFFVTTGPGLEVFLSPVDVVGPGSLGLGPIQSARGAQAYPLAAGVGLTEHNWVLIHCVPFNITFGKARLQ